jgi:hypothetical protein
MSACLMVAGKVKRIDDMEFDRTIITDPPTPYTLVRLCRHLRHLDLLRDPIDPIVVIEYRNGYFLIIDGNTRALLAAQERAPLGAVVIPSGRDRDAILRMERRQAIPGLPQREFLTGRITFPELKRHAVRHSQEYGYRTIQDILDVDLTTLRPGMPPLRWFTRRGVAVGAGI